MKKLSGLFMLMLLLFSVTITVSAVDLASSNPSFQMGSIETTIQSTEGAAVVSENTDIQNEIHSFYIGDRPAVCSYINNKKPMIDHSFHTVQPLSIVVMVSDAGNEADYITGFKRWNDHPSFKGIA